MASTIACRPSGFKASALGWLVGTGSVDVYSRSFIFPSYSAVLFSETYLSCLPSDHQPQRVGSRV